MNARTRCPRHGDARPCVAAVGREADEHAARRGGLGGWDTRAAELAQERARRGHAIVDVHKVIARLGPERAEAQRDWRARRDDVLARDVDAIPGWDGDRTGRCREGTRTVRTRGWTKHTHKYVLRKGHRKVLELIVN